MEDAANRIVGHYERHALSWDADRRAAGWIDKPCIERFLSFLPRGATILDLGCGGGSPVALHMVCQWFSRHRRGQLSDPHLAMPKQDAGSGMDRRRYAIFGPQSAISRDLSLGQLLPSPAPRPANDV